MSPAGGKSDFVKDASGRYWDGGFDAGAKRGGREEEKRGGECQETKVRKTSTRQSIVSPPGKSDFLKVVPEH